MLPLPLVVLLTLAAGPDRTVPVGCREDFETCREDCTIDYGGSTTKYRQLSQCIQSCENEKAECTTRHYSLRDTGYDAPARDPEAPASRPETPRDGVRRGVYRAAESEPAPAPEPAVMKEPEPKAEPSPEPEPEARPTPRPKTKQKSQAKRTSAKSEDMRIFDDTEPEAEAEPAPAPEPEPAPRPAPPRPVPPAEPKKKDISDWDPNER